MSLGSGAMPTLRFVLNGVQAVSVCPADRRLAQILRDEHGLTSARMACGIGRCGACMVLWNGRPVNACLVMAWQIDGAQIVTAEGLDTIPQARIVKTALAEENAFQCGYCTSGMIVSATALLHQHADPSQDQIIQAMEGNICRCGTYPRILEAIKRASRMQTAGASR